MPVRLHRGPGGRVLDTLEPGVRHLLTYGVMPPAGTAGRLLAFMLLRSERRGDLEALWRAVGQDLLAALERDPPPPLADPRPPSDFLALEVLGPDDLAVVGASASDAGPWGAIGYLADDPEAA